MIDLGAANDPLVKAQHTRSCEQRAQHQRYSHRPGPGEATTTITDTGAATWSIRYRVVIEGNPASYTVHLAGTLQAGETATIDLASPTHHLSADYANFVTAVNTAISGRPT